MKNNALKLFLFLIFTVHAFLHGDVPYPNYKYNPNYLPISSVSSSENYSYINNPTMMLAILAVIIASQKQKSADIDQDAKAESQEDDVSSSL